MRSSPDLFSLFSRFAPSTWQARGEGDFGHMHSVTLSMVHVRLARALHVFPMYSTTSIVQGGQSKIRKTAIGLPELRET